jgi:hypothetical protein
MAIVRMEDLGEATLQCVAIAILINGAISRGLHHLIETELVRYLVIEALPVLIPELEETVLLVRKTFAALQILENNKALAIDQG